MGVAMKSVSAGGNFGLTFAERLQLEAGGWREWEVVASLKGQLQDDPTNYGAAARRKGRVRGPLNSSTALLYLGTGHCEVLAAGLPDTKLLLSEFWDGRHHLLDSLVRAHIGHQPHPHRMVILIFQRRKLRLL